MCAFLDPTMFAGTAVLAAACPGIRAEACSLSAADFVESPDSLTAVADGYDETGWRYFVLRNEDGDHAANLTRCTVTARAIAAVPGLVNAGFSLFRPGTHLYPHRGELPGVVRCHLPLVVPPGDVALRFGGEVRQWRPGQCVVFDDTVEHEAWNHGASDRIVLLVTFLRRLGKAHG